MSALLLAALALTASPAHAQATPATRGAVVGSLAAAGELGGMLAGGGVGLAIGASSCGGNSFECWGPLIGAGLGAFSGALVGPPVTAGLVSHAYGLRGGRVAAWTVAGAGIGGGVMLVGALTGSNELVSAGLVTGMVGMPVAAGIAAASQTPREQADLPLVQVVPGVVKGGGSLRLVVRGF